MSNAVRNRLEAFLDTPAGQRFMDEAQAEAAAKEAAVRLRRLHASKREECIRRRDEVIPGMKARVAEAEAEHREAREAEKVANRKACDARLALFNEGWSLQEGQRQAEIELTRTADPRIHAGIEEAADALHLWSETRGRLRRFRRETATNWDGTETWTKRFGNNDAGLDALHENLQRSRALLEQLAIVAEPTEEAIAEGLARVKDAIAATQGEPPPIVMVEYDREGRPKSR